MTFAIIMRSFAALAGLAFFWIVPCAAQNAVTTKVDDFIKTEVQKQRISGLSVAVVKVGQIVLAKGYGFANVEHQVALYLGRAEPPLPSICVSALDCTNLFEHVKIENKEMLPTNNYFQQTTRLVLNQREKQEIIDATERAVMHVLSMGEFRSVCPGDIPGRLQGLRERMAYLRQAIHLTKGSVQPRYSMGDRDVSRSQRKRKQLRRKRESNYTLFSIDFWI